ncbi:acetylornithine deacetylase [Litorimonas cladophorae]|uniref:Acetylornithine deacetylase n=1 Tax=Litorimonas cladophorae TaxID=1220491 RepID=A0A918NBP8_9PROT|nr:acetylornithine deacetylase [Litorimonas cladophorae]
MIGKAACLSIARGLLRLGPLAISLRVRGAPRIDSINTSSLLDHLETLVSFDTRNGSGDEMICVRYLEETLNGFAPDQLHVAQVPRSRGKTDSGYVLAIWGKPETLLNVHIDTVPSGAGWTADPLDLQREADRVVGLGTSDIKGAAACILAALETVAPKNVAVLFSGDEEHGSEIMPAVIASDRLDGVKRAIVCEPTSCRVGRAHRGMLAISAGFSGPGGHSSLADVTARPLLDAARLAAKIGEYADAYLNFGAAPFKGLCVNIGEIESDGAYNVIPTQAKLWLSLRPPPGDDVGKREADIYALAGQAALDTIVAFEPFATKDMSKFADIFGETEIVDLPYWTEAAMLSQAGVNAVVYGPGNLEQAHKPNEYVEIEQLEVAAQRYAIALQGS